MEIVVREYSDTDEVNILECIAQLQDFVGLTDPLERIRTGKYFDASAYIQKTINEYKSGKGIIFIAEQSGKFVGCVTGIIHAITQDNLERYSTKDGIINELYILPECRGKGIGAALIQKIEEYFWTKDCSVIKIDCFTFNKDAYSF